MVYSAEEPDEPRRADLAVECLRAARLWYWEQLGGNTFELAAPVMFRSVFSRRQLVDQFLADGAIDYVGMWLSLVREAITCGVIANDDAAVNYFVSALPGIEPARAAKWDFFGVSAILSTTCSRLLCGRDPKRRDLLWVAGEMAHELGHALTSHTEMIPNLESHRNVMGWGHSVFPNCSLNEEQRSVLWTSPFLGRLDARPVCALLEHWNRPAGPVRENNSSAV